VTVEAKRITTIAAAVTASPEAVDEETNTGENILIMPGNGGIIKNKVS
jgi:hypothetical protein